MLSLSQPGREATVIPPTLKAALSGYHIILMPVPLTGGLPGLMLESPLNNTLLSCTCSRAFGLLVLMPTFPWASAQPEMARGVAKGVLHKNTASRKFSRLTKRLASLG